MLKHRKREEVLQAVREVARQSPLDDREVERAMNLPGGFLRYDRLGHDISDGELAAIEEWMRGHGARDQDIHAFRRKLGLIAG